MTSKHAATLYILGDRGHTVDGSANDVRGRRVKDQNGDGIGRVDLVDDQPHHASVYGYYGYEPYWGEGYLYPADMARLPVSPLGPRS